jgi:hypothetical protein
MLTTELAFSVRRSLSACSNTCREDVGGGGPRLPGTPKRRRVGLSRRSSGECRCRRPILHIVMVKNIDVREIAD